jgi:Gram-negative bacterial TonB protein C-terminal
MDALIGVDGYVKDINVRGGADPDLASAAVLAVREWRYSQTILNCTPVDVSMKITTKFALQQ